jgi:hypothetical protein
MSFTQLKATYPEFYQHAKQVGYLIGRREGISIAEKQPENTRKVSGSKGNKRIK